ncbi:DUF2490 domain-containing protein [Chryseolinea sp. T2]|uniref:DUF2490 domain-containing protein n=1 Tax=Chryseolinea sp. T2 TaxID=3129255 RepID=UPI0030782917
MKVNVRMGWKNLMLVAWLLLARSIPIQAQSSHGQQLWNEFYVNHSFANVYELQNRVRYRTNFGSSKWRALDLMSILDRSLTQNIDVVAGLTFSYVFQNDTVNTLEIRPMLGARVHFTPNRRVQSRLYLRFEQRNMHDQGSSDWQHSTRLRLRPELLIPLNKKSYFDDKLLYAIVDAEWFIVFDKDVDERYANRFRFRGGVGYRMSRQWRFEVIYMQQLSKNKIGTDFDSNDDIVRLRVKWYPARKQRQAAPTK